MAAIFIVFGAAIFAGLYEKRKLSLGLLGAGMFLILLIFCYHIVYHARATININL